MKCTIDSKALSNFTATPIPRLGIHCAKYFHWTTAVPESGSISLARQFIFSKASRFIWSFI